MEETKKDLEPNREEKVTMGDIVYGMLNAGLLLQIKAMELKETSMPESDVPDDLQGKLESLYGLIISNNFKHQNLNDRLNEYVLFTKKLQEAIFGKESSIIKPEGIIIH